MIRELRYGTGKHHERWFRLVTWAADPAGRKLVDPLAYARAEAISPDVAFIAEELDVTQQIVLDYQQYCLERIGTVTYVDSRMGVGQWTARAALA